LDEYPDAFQGAQEPEQRRGIRFSSVRKFVNMQWSIGQKIWRALFGSDRKGACLPEIEDSRENLFMWRGLCVLHKSSNKLLGHCWIS
jgi:hypothetical protein